MFTNFKPILFLIILISIIDSFDFLESSTTKGDLHSKLLVNYNRNVRPVRNHINNTSVQLSLSVNNIQLDEHDQTLTVICYLHLTWNDEFLKWSPEENNITSLHFDRDEIWIPDIALFNNAKNADITPKSMFPLLVYNNGFVIWSPHFTAQVPCLLDISLWPSDKQTCDLKFGSWSHHGEEIDLVIPPHNSGINLEYYQQNDRWKLLNYNVTKMFNSYDGIIYHYIKYTLTIERLAASHAIYISQTTLTVIVVVLSSYVLPLKFHLSRFLLHLFSLATLVICNLAMFATLPASSGHVPFVVKYFSGAMILTTLSLLAQVVMANTITQVTETTFGIRGVFRSLVGFPRSISTRNHLVNQEVSYSNLEGETMEPSEMETPDPRSQAPQQIPQNTSSSPTVPDIHRVINIVLFCMFSVSYTVDYAILRSSIGN